MRPKRFPPIASSLAPRDTVAFSAFFSAASRWRSPRTRRARSKSCVRGSRYPFARTGDSSMARARAQQVDPTDEQIISALPARLRGFLCWLERPSMRWVRIPLGFILMLTGLLGFLPVVGFWMIPLGALLLAQEIPVLRRPALRFLTWMNRVLTRSKDRSDNVP